MVATLPGSSTMDCTCTIGNFDASIFELAAASNFEDPTSRAADPQAYEGFTSEILTITSNEATFTGAPVADDDPDRTGLHKLYIAGMKEVATTPAAEGEFQITSSGTPAVFKATFFASEFTDGSEVEVSYETVMDVKEVVSDNKTSAVGTLFAVYPIYSNGDDCTESGILGKVMLKVFRCRVTAKPALAGSYKTASTYDVTFSAIKNNSSDNRGKTYSIAYIKG